MSKSLSRRKFVSQSAVAAAYLTVFKKDAIAVPVQNVKVQLTPYFLNHFKASYSSVRKAGWSENRLKSGGGDFYQVMTQLNENIAGFTADCLKKGNFPVAVIGDCCKTCGVVKGLNKCGKHPFILWFDAHGDFNTHKSSPSGFIGGMALAILTGHEESRLLSQLGINPVPEHMVTAYDLRNLDPEEAKLMMNSQIERPDTVAALLKLCQRHDAIYLHIDADVLNPEEAPAMLYPAKGGPSSLIMRSIVESLKDKIIAASVTIWEPERDQNKVTEKAVMSILQPLFDFHKQ